MRTFQQYLDLQETAPTATKFGQEALGNIALNANQRTALAQLFQIFVEIYANNPAAAQTFMRTHMPQGQDMPQDFEQLDLGMLRQAAKRVSKFIIDDIKNSDEGLGDKTDSVTPPAADKYMNPMG
jgi:hypothetical protein